MKKKLSKTPLIITLFCLFSIAMHAQTTHDIRFMRSQYENVNDIIGDIDADGEGSGIVYSIASGNEAGHYAIRLGTGEITVAAEIADQNDVVTEHTLTVHATQNNVVTQIFSVQIVDLYDYLISTTPHTTLLEQDDATAMNTRWTAYNNLWGKGTAVEGVDFRIALLINETITDNAMIIWDTPGPASQYGGASVWNYTNIFLGNRYGMRDDVPGFPFKIADMKQMVLDFDIEPIMGDDKFKVALNTFLTDESVLSPFSANDGDFFFVPDQKGTWIPNYPVTLDDITIGGKPFAVRYDKNTTNNYERRRVIIKDKQQLLQGPVDMMAQFDLFAGMGYLNKEQYIYHLMFGVEVTEGYGALKINNLDITISDGVTTPTPTPTITPSPTPAFINIAAGKPVYTSSDYAPSFPAVNTVDGDHNTIWGSGTDNANEWLYIDLQAVTEVNGLGLFWFENYYAGKYSVYASNNGKDWTLLASLPKTASGDDVFKDNISFNTRYIGILFNSKKAAAVALREFEVYRLVR